MPSERLHNALDGSITGNMTQEDVDWRRVGRVHDPKAPLEHVIAKEVERLNKAFDIKLTE